jgi:hypothetical protein
MRLAASGVRQSMTRGGAPGEHMESFFDSLSRTGTPSPRVRLCPRRRARTHTPVRARGFESRETPHRLIQFATFLSNFDGSVVPRSQELSWER